MSGKPDLREIIANDEELTLNVLKQSAIALHRAAGLVYAIVDWNDVKDAPLRTLVIRELPKDLSELRDVLAKYGIRMYVTFEVENEKAAGRIIGKNGRKIKKLATFYGLHFRVVPRRDGSG